MVRRDGGRGNSHSFQWGASSSAAENALDETDPVVGEENGKGKKKGNKGKKNVIMGWG